MDNFFFKLIPPRKDFHLVISDDEKKIMDQHADYWANLTRDNKAITYGPVFHKDGVFGIALLEVETAELAQEIIENDPAISSKLCNCELSPMSLGLIRK